MEKFKMIIAGSASILFAAATVAKAPVIMTVNGEDVPKSEFEYLYKKNSQQQLVQQPIEDYLEMFKLYKLKVADAKAAGIDTTAKFRKEIDQYRHDLAAPYMTDSTYLNKLLKETYDRSLQEVEANHIMIFKAPEPEANRKSKETLDSIRNLLLQGEDYAELAKKHSQDRGSAQAGGRMGYITAQQYPYNFETTVYNTPEGEIAEITETPVGYHLIKGGKHRKARGKVKAAHILKLTQGMSEADAQKAKESLDSIYNLAIANPEDFDKLARENSDDQGSAKQGGMLPEFGTGQMVEPFDSAAFSIPDNSISKPFQTSYGWHIIKRFSAVEPQSMQELKPSFLTRIANPQDERYAMIKRNQTSNLAAKHKSKINTKTLDAIKETVAKQGLDSAAFATLESAPYSEMILLTIDKKPRKVSEFVKKLKKFNQTDSQEAVKLLSTVLDDYYNSELVAAEEQRLYNEVADYRNLLNEYIDGSLLYEISVENIWDKAANDIKGLENYFNNNRNNYKWSIPHAKGILVQALNDSIANEIRTASAGISEEDVVNEMRKKFKGEAIFERVLVEKGANKIIDYLMFGGPEAKSPRANYTSLFMIFPRILDAPETFKDVKGLVTNDYQNELQSIWEEELKAKYPVTVNSKVLKSVK